MVLPRLFMAGLLASTACAAEPGESVCEEAAAKLVGCNEDQQTAFANACHAAGEEAALEAIDATDYGEACAVQADARLDQATAALQGVCVASMYGVKWTVGAFSSSPQPLTSAMKTALRPKYGNLVDWARISYNSWLPGGISVGDYELSVEPAAMTFGNKIYVAGDYTQNATSVSLFYTVVHEMQHVRQVNNAGGFWGFANKYCLEMIQAGFDYHQIDSEENAKAVTDAARAGRLYCNSFGC